MCKDVFVVMVLVMESITLNQHSEGDGFLTLNVRHLVIRDNELMPFAASLCLSQTTNLTIWLWQRYRVCHVQRPSEKMFNPFPHLLMSQWVFFKGNYLIILSLMARIGATHNHKLDLFTFALTHGCWGLSLQVYILHSPAHLTGVRGLPMLIDFFSVENIW